MKKSALIISIIFNILLTIAVGADTQEVQVVEKIVEVPVKQSAKQVEKITATYEKCVDGSLVVEFSDNSYALFDDVKKEYIFQPECMGDWDMDFENADHLKMAMETYFAGKEVVVVEPNMEQSEENKILNPEQYIVMEKELNKLPASIKKLLVDNGVEIIINEIVDEKEDIETFGRYYWDYNLIEMDVHNYSIEEALVHEVGHALDDFLDFRTEKIIASYENDEIVYENPHHNSSIEEYIAEGIACYYNNTMNKNTDMYKELHKILGGYR